MMNNDIQISAEVTPNPNTLKFNINKVLIESGSLNFTSRDQARGSVLAERLFDVENVIGVMVGRDFITITKQPTANWQVLVQPVTETLKSVLKSSENVVQAPAEGGATVATAGPGGEIERKIREVLDTEIRPAVAMDGGDILFHGYKDGVVTLHLQGSCSSCPSSIMTLKMGVENRLKALIPEVREVVQV